MFVMLQKDPYRHNQKIEISLMYVFLSFTAV